jgi:hypothetical protein
MSVIALGLFAAASLSGLKPGATIVLPAGPHPRIEMRQERFDPPVTIDASRAVVAGVNLMHVEGVILKGGIIEAPKGRNGAGPNGYGITGRHLRNVSFDRLEVREALRGMVIGSSDGVRLTNSRFHALRSDGVNMAGVTNVLIENNRFEDFKPIKARGSRKEGNFVDGDHPDAIQIWTNKERPFGRDITIKGNYVEADTQGINFFGPQGEGYDRVRILDNVVKIPYPAALSIFKCRDCEMRGNRVASFPGSRFKANIRVVNSTGKFCGNHIAGVKTHSTIVRC